MTYKSRTATIGPNDNVTKQTAKLQAAPPAEPAYKLRRLERQQLNTTQGRAKTSEAKTKLRQAETSARTERTRRSKSGASGTWPGGAAHEPRAGTTTRRNGRGKGRNQHEKPPRGANKTKDKRAGQGPPQRMTIFNYEKTHLANLNRAPVVGKPKERATRREER